MTSDKRVHALLVLLELDDLLLYRRNVLLSDVHVSGINNGLPSFCLWVPRYLLQSRKAKLFDCLCDVGPTFILSLYVVSYRIDCLLVFLYLAEYFAFPMSKVWLSSPNTFVTIPSWSAVPQPSWAGGISWPPRSWVRPPTCFLFLF